MKKFLTVCIFALLLISCEKEKNAPIVVEEIKLTNSEISIVIGEEHKLDFQILPENAVDKTVTFSSSDENIASISNEGVITAKAKGETTITIRSSNDITNECKIKVDEVGVMITDKDGAEIKSIKLEGQKVVELFATISPKYYEAKSRKWEVSNKEFIKITEDGKLSAVKPTIKDEKLTVTLTIDDKYKASCPVSIDELSSIITDKDGKELKTVTLNLGETFQLKSKITPEYYKPKSIKWESLNSEIVSVSETGLLTPIAATKEGTPIEIKLIVDNTIETKCSVSINKVDVTGLELENPRIFLVEGNSTAITHKILPENASNKEFTWKSTNEKVAVIKDNQIKGVGFGKANIEVITAEGKHKATYIITVRKESVSNPAPITGVWVYEKMTIVDGSSESDIEDVIEDLESEIEDEPSTMIEYRIVMLEQAQRNAKAKIFTIEEAGTGYVEYTNNASKGKTDALIWNFLSAGKYNVIFGEGVVVSNMEFNITSDGHASMMLDKEQKLYIKRK